MYMLSRKPLAKPLITMNSAMLHATDISVARYLRGLRRMLRADMRPGKPSA